jgi:hypothetical protein
MVEWYGPAYPESFPEERLFTLRACLLDDAVFAALAMAGDEELCALYAGLEGARMIVDRGHVYIACEDAARIFPDDARLYRMIDRGIRTVSQRTQPRAEAHPCMN